MIFNLYYIAYLINIYHSIDLPIHLSLSLSIHLSVSLSFDTRPRSRYRSYYFIFDPFKNNFTEELSTSAGFKLRSSELVSLSQPPLAAASALVGKMTFHC